jgi:hypothetical protein
MPSYHKNVIAFFFKYKMQIITIVTNYNEKKKKKKETN